MNTVLTYLPLVLSSVAILVSIASIRAHNKGVVFEKRLEIYCETEKLYQKSVRIIELCPCKMDGAQNSLIGQILFDFNSPEQQLLERSATIKDKSLKSPKFAELADKYAEVYFQKYLHGSKIDNAGIFFSKEIADCIKRLYDHIDEMRLGILVYEQKEIAEWIEELNRMIMDIDEREILKKMKKKLPI